MEQTTVVVSEEVQVVTMYIPGPPGPSGDYVQGSVRLTVGPTAPLNPTLNDLWVDIT